MCRLSLLPAIPHTFFTLNCIVDANRNGALFLSLSLSLSLSEYIYIYAYIYIYIYIYMHIYIYIEREREREKEKIESVHIIYMVDDTKIDNGHMFG